MQKKENYKVFTNIIQSQISYLYRHTWLNFWGNFVTATVAASLFLLSWEKNVFLLFLWYISTLIVGIFRLKSGHNFDEKTEYTQKELQFWANKYIFYTTMLATLWGVAGILLFPSNTVYQVILVIILTTVLLLAIPTLATSRLAFNLQIAVILSPIVIQFFMDGSSIYNLLGVCVVLMGITMIMASHYICQVLLDLYQTRLKAQQQANTDQLTDIANRRFFDQYFKLEWRRAIREHSPLALMMIDVDYFKKYNDHYGHQVGDNCLKKITKTMKHVMYRPGDLVARHGGEEFVALLPNTDLRSATLIAEQLRTEILAQKITHPNSDISTFVTVSIGVSCCYPVGKNTKKHNVENLTHFSLNNSKIVYPAMLLHSADKAMYQAKQYGRNQVVSKNCGGNILSIPVNPVKKKMNKKLLFNKRKNNSAL